MNDLPRRCLVIWLDPETDEIETDWTGMSIYEAWGVMKSALMYLEDQASIVTEPETQGEETE